MCSLIQKIRSSELENEAVVLQVEIPYQLETPTGKDHEKQKCTSELEVDELTAYYCIRFYSFQPRTVMGAVVGASSHKLDR